MTAADVVTVCLTTFGAAFFFAGTVGILRFPDVHSRMHALTKADNLGLGLVVAGLLPQAGSPAIGVKLVLIWILVIWASATASYLIANRAFDEESSSARLRDVELPR